MGGNIKMNLGEMVWEGVDWINLAHDRGQLQALVNTLMNLILSKKAGNFLTS
jgi:hypothetical protein